MIDHCLLLGLQPLIPGRGLLLHASRNQFIDYNIPWLLPNILLPHHNMVLHHNLWNMSTQIQTQACSSMSTNTMLQQTVENQFHEQLIDEDQFCHQLMNIPNQIITEIQQDIKGGQIDWGTIKEGLELGTIPLLLKMIDSGNHLDVRGVMLWFFSSFTHVEHALFISALLFTCIVSQTHVLLLSFISASTSYMQITGLTHAYHASYMRLYSI